MFKLNPNPTFKAVVSIPTAGDEPQPLALVFKHMTRDALMQWLDDASATDVTIAADAAKLALVIAGWEGVTDAGGEVAFSVEALAALLSNYSGAAPAISGAYTRALTKGRQGN